MPAHHIVAVLDADEEDRGATAGLLERAGYQVRAFESGDAFLAAHLPGDSDCVLLDMRMPGTDGLGVLEAMGAWESMPAVLVLVGYGAVQEAIAALKLGAADFLEKPYPPQDLLAAIAQALAAGSKKRTGSADPAAAAKVATLSQRQHEVLHGILDGRPNRIIAFELGLSIRTVEVYRVQILEKLGVRGTADAVRLAMAAGIASGPRRPRYHE